MSTTFSEFLVGKVLHDKYRVEALIGAGGMGAVFRAEHVGTGRPVAVKTILPSLLRSPEALGRFQREARAAGSMRHPNIVDVTDFGVAHLDGVDVAYLVMEHLEGRTLGELLEERGRIEPDLAVEIIEQIAVALDVAHQKGIVHRDLKPDNIWLVPDGRGGFVIRVLDFGIAKLLDATSEATAPRDVAGHDTVVEVEAASHMDSTTVRSIEPASTRSDDDDLTATMDADGTMVRTPSSSITSELTTVGTTIGTPAYMSPEQCAGRDVTQRSDIYSLGVIAWQCLVGRRVFQGKFADLIRQHLSERPPRADEENRALSARLGIAVARALEKNPDDRYETAGAMAGSLRVAIEGPGTILRRSTILFLERPREFLRVSWKAAVPQLLLTIPAIGIAWWMGSQTTTVYFASLFGALAWGVTTGTTHVAFGVVVDSLRTAPLAPLSVDEVFGRINRRLGLDERTPLVRLIPKLMLFYLLCELRAPAGQGDLAVQIALHEGRGPSEIKERCAELAASTKRAYDRVRLVLIGSLLVFPFVFGFALIAIAALMGLHLRDASIFAASAAMFAVPLVAVFGNPMLSPALALLYFRARQARGEAVSLGAVMSSRL